MLFWLLVYVTVLLSLFQSSMFQSGLYEDTNKAAYQERCQPISELLTWFVAIVILKILQILKFNKAQEIHTFGIHQTIKSKVTKVEDFNHWSRA